MKRPATQPATKTDLILSQISLTPFLTPSTSEARLAQSALLSSALKSTGLFSLTLDAPTTAATAAAFAAARALFALPPSAKAALTAASPLPARGYKPAQAESGGAAAEDKEQFCCSGRPSPADIWPADAATASALRAYVAAASRVARAVASAMALALDDAEIERFVSDEALAISCLRVFHYFAGGGGALGSTPHTDWGAFTIISLEDGGGDALEVLDGGVWRSVGGGGGGARMVVNCGDFLQLRTGGLWKSPVHRVVLTERERISFVFFLYPPYDTPMPEAEGEAAYSQGRLLSVLQDQSEGGREGGVERWTGAFGGLIDAKWRQVTRSGDAVGGAQVGKRGGER